MSVKICSCFILVKKSRNFDAQTHSPRDIKLEMLLDYVIKCLFEQSLICQILQKNWYEKTSPLPSKQATAGVDSMVIKKNQIYLVVICQNILRDFAGECLDRWMRKMLFNQPKKKSHARKCLCLPDSMMLLSNQKN